VRRRASARGREKARFDGRRPGSWTRRTFTGLRKKRSRIRGRVSRIHCEAAWSLRIDRGVRDSIGAGCARKKTPRTRLGSIRLSPLSRRETRCGSVARPKVTRKGSRQVEQRVREPEARVPARRDLIEIQRDTGARTLNVRWQKPVSSISRCKRRGVARRIDACGASASLCGSRHDAARSRSLRETVQRSSRLSYRSARGIIRGLDLAGTRHGGTRSGSWLLHPFNGVGQVRLWRVGWSGPESKDDGALELRSNGFDTRCPAATEGVRGRLAFGKGSSSRIKGAMGRPCGASKDVIARVEGRSTEAGSG